MVKKAYLIHGWDGNPKGPLFEWMGERLNEKGYEFVAPKMPNPEEPIIEDWLEKINYIVKDLGEKDIFIGHSVGCQAVLKYMETLKDEKISSVLLIAPWMHLDETTIEEEGEEVKEIAKPWMETPINWEKIKNHCNNFICVFSDNDSCVPISEMDLFKENLGAKTVLLKNKGHFDPNSGIKSLPEILKFLK